MQTLDYVSGSQNCLEFPQPSSSTSVYGLEFLVLEGTGGKALATDHRGLLISPQLGL